MAHHEGGPHVNDEEALSLRPLGPDDLPQLHAWFRQDHVRPWFGERSMEDVREEYEAYFDGRELVTPFVVLLGSRPIGMVGWSRFGDFPEMMESYEVDDPDAANCDILIGDLASTRRGIGPRVIDLLLREHVFADPRITSCIIDPHEDNARAIRAYEKAGFRYLRTVRDHEDGRALHLMELRRERA
jgi:RimJ/RimL family protein N-acetyltransferase